MGIILCRLFSLICLNAKLTALVNQIWKVIWKWEGPNRIRYFLWMVAHDKILTNLEIFKRHLSINDLCLICHLESESTIMCF